MLKNNNTIKNNTKGSDSFNNIFPVVDGKMTKKSVNYSYIILQDFVGIF